MSRPVYRLQSQNAAARKLFPMSLSQWTFLTLLSVLWGGSFFFVGFAVQDVPPLTLVFLRVFLAAIALALATLAMRQYLPRSLHAWYLFAGMALLNNVIPFTLIAFGQREVASALASILNATTPLWTVVIAHAFTGDEKLTTNRLVGVLFGLIGVAVLVGPEAAIQNTTSLVAMMLIIGATISYGFAGLWGRQLRGTSPLVSATGQLICSSAILLPLAAIVDQPWLLPRPDTTTIYAIAALALLSTALAYIVFFHVLAVSGPTNVMLVTLLIPISATFLGITLLAETLTYGHIAGALIIAGSLLIFDGRVINLFHGKDDRST